MNTNGGFPAYVYHGCSPHETGSEYEEPIFYFEQPTFTAPISEVDNTEEPPPRRDRSHLVATVVLVAVFLLAIVSLRRGR